MAFVRHRRHTFALLWGACLRFVSLWRANSWWFECPGRSSFKRLLRSAILSSQIVHLLKVCWIFVKRTYLRVCWRSTIDLCLMNLPKCSSFKSVLKVNTLSKILLWIKPSYFSLENACYSWCMHQTGLFSSAPLCYKVNLPASCEAQRLLCLKVNLPGCVATRP